MAESTNPLGTASVTDRRPVPAGVLPRGAQTWLMAGIAGVMVLIMFVAGRPEQGRRPTPTPVPQSAPSPDRLRDYQDRLRVMETRATQDAQQPATPQSTAAPSPPTSPDGPRPSGQDSLVAERRRRNYESLFASNIVFSRRPEAERPDASRQDAVHTGIVAPLPSGSASLDDVAEAVLRATARASTGVAAAGSPVPAPGTPGDATVPVRAMDHSRRTDPVTASQVTHRLIEGTIIDTVLANRLDGASAAPVNCLVTNPVYSPSGRAVIIPAGARILGDTKPVQSVGETRLAVAFHRLIMPDGRTYTLDAPPALNQPGDSGLHDQVDGHYWSTFGASAAVGLISGLAQFVGTAGFGGSGSDRTVIIAGPADASTQASTQVLNRLLNRLPTITIREGHRIKVYLTRDLELPPYVESAGL